MHRVSYLLLILILFVGITSCGDDSTGPDVGDPPQTPNLEQAQPDVSFFQDNNPQAESTNVVTATNNYSQAQSIVLWNSIMFSFAQSYSSLFSEVNREEADYDDGVWEWSYDYSYGGITADYRTIAEELSDGVRWEMYWSFDDGQGEGFEDYKIFEGTVSNDESSGDWTFNAMDPELDQEVPFITSDWTTTSETEKEITLEMFGDSIDDEAAEETATIHFEQDGADFTMDLVFADGDDYLVSWNTDTNIGSITYDDGEQLCWDEEFQDVSCE